MQKKTMTKKEINVFIENIYDDFNLDGKGIVLSDMINDAVLMTEYFLSQDLNVKNSCLNNCEFKKLYFDVVLTNDEKIHEINLEYRQKDCATDVITFAIFADSPEDEKFVFDNEVNLGELIISLDTALKQSKDNSHHQTTFKDELYFLLAHGILHLMGYDHQDENTLNEMWQLQKEMTDSLKKVES